jgi:predicted DNA-binding transcriptional regulator YafY
LLIGLIDLIDATASRRVVRFDYRSPWKPGEAARRTVRPLHVRSSDGGAYLLGQTDGSERVFNLSFIDRLEVTDETFEPAAETADRDWNATFGVWLGTDAVVVKLRIGAPGAEYFAGQQWHPAQQDTWDHGVLVRELPGHVSPELVRRLLGLGQSLLGVEPAALRAQVVEAARAVVDHLA